MTLSPHRVRPAIAVFVALTGALAANIFYMQPGARSLAGLGEHGPVPAWSLQLATGSTSRPAALDGEGPVDRAEVTRAVQRELNVQGYEAGAVDGIAGLVTRAAIMAYEADRGLALTGEPDAGLLKRLVLGASKDAPAQSKGRPTQEPGPQAEMVIKAVQRALDSQGLDPGPVDGRLTGQTVKAIRAFEAAQKLPETGRISGPLLARIGRLAGQQGSQTQAW